VPPQTPPLRNTTRRHWGLSSSGVALGISLGGVSDAREAASLLHWVDRAEALGLHSVWIPEMHFAPGVATAPLVLLAACAARSRRLRLGTTSLLLPIRSAVRVAEEVAALDRLSGGRVLLGLGRGFRAPLFEAFGIDATSKRELFDRALDGMLERWADAALPRQRPHPPLAVAAFGRKGLLQASQRALPYLASPLEPLDLIEENLRFHRANLPAAVLPSDLVVPVMRTVHVAASDAEAKRVVAALEDEQRRTRPAGPLPAVIARAAAAGVHQRAVVGLRQEVVDHLGAYRERLGMDLLVARPQVRGATPSEREAALERLAGDVIPALVA